MNAVNSLHAEGLKNVCNYKTVCNKCIWVAILATLICTANKVNHPYALLYYIAWGQLFWQGMEMRLKIYDLTFFTIIEQDRTGAPRPIDRGGSASSPPKAA
jgi:hypothetical protein